MIVTKNLILQRFTEGEISENYLAWLNDKELMKFSEQRHRSHTRETALAYFRSFNHSINFFLSIKTRENQDHIGNLTIYTDVNNRVCDIGILIGDSRYSGKGLGLEAWRAAIDYLFSQKICRKVTAGTMALNGPMIKIFKKSGMCWEGTRRKQFLVGEAEVDLLQYAIFRDS